MINICCSSPLITRTSNDKVLVKECPDCGTIIRTRKRQPEGKYQLILYIEPLDLIKNDNIELAIRKMVEYLLKHYHANFSIRTYRIKQSVHRIKNDKT